MSLLVESHDADGTVSIRPLHGSGPTLRIPTKTAVMLANVLLLLTKEPTQ